MNEKNLPPSFDVALANVNPERRRFLGMLLTGAAALPLLTSTDLAAGMGQGGTITGEPYVGEIRCFSFGKVPTGWLPCNGQTLPIVQNQALYSLLGTQFGGNGTTNFNLPKLNGVAPVHYSSGVGNVGSSGGAETVPLTADQMAAHTHTVNVNSNTGTVVLPTDDYLAASPSPHLAYGQASNPLVAMAGDIVGSSSGTGSAHPNMQPSLVLNYCIATTGIYPMRP